VESKTAYFSDSAPSAPLGRKLMQASGSSVVVPTEIKVDVASSSAGTTGAMENLNKVVSTLAEAPPLTVNGTRYPSMAMTMITSATTKDGSVVPIEADMPGDSPYPYDPNSPGMMPPNGTNYTDTMMKCTETIMAFNTDCGMGGHAQDEPSAPTDPSKMAEIFCADKCKAAYDKVLITCPSEMTQEMEHAMFSMCSPCDLESMKIASTCFDSNPTISSPSRRRNLLQGNSPTFSDFSPGNSAGGRPFDSGPSSEFGGCEQESGGSMDITKPGCMQVIEKVVDVCSSDPNRTQMLADMKSYLDGAKAIGFPDDVPKEGETMVLSGTVNLVPKVPGEAPGHDADMLRSIIAQDISLEDYRVSAKKVAEMSYEIKIFDENPNTMIPLYIGLSAGPLPLSNTPFNISIVGKPTIEVVKGTALSLARKAAAETPLLDDPEDLPSECRGLSETQCSSNPKCKVENKCETLYDPCDKHMRVGHMDGTQDGCPQMHSSPSMTMTWEQSCRKDESCKVGYDPFDQMGEARCLNEIKCEDYDSSPRKCELASACYTRVECVDVCEDCSGCQSATTTAMKNFTTTFSNRESSVEDLAYYMSDWFRNICSSDSSTDESFTNMCKSYRKVLFKNPELSVRPKSLCMALGVCNKDCLGDDTNLCEADEAIPSNLDTALLGTVSTAVDSANTSRTVDVGGACENTSDCKIGQCTRGEVTIATTDSTTPDVTCKPDVTCDPMTGTDTRGACKGVCTSLCDAFMAEAEEMNAESCDDDKTCAEKFGEGYACIESQISFFTRCTEEKGIFAERSKGFCVLSKVPSLLPNATFSNDLTEIKVTLEAEAQPFLVSARSIFTTDTSMPLGTGAYVTAEGNTLTVILGRNPTIEDGGELKLKDMDTGRLKDMAGRTFGDSVVAKVSLPLKLDPPVCIIRGPMSIAPPCDDTAATGIEMAEFNAGGSYDPTGRALKSVEWSAVPTSAFDVKPVDGAALSAIAAVDTSKLSAGKYNISATVTSSLGKTSTCSFAFEKLAAAAPEIIFGAREKQEFAASEGFVLRSKVELDSLCGEGSKVSYEWTLSEKSVQKPALSFEDSPYLVIAPGQVKPNEPLTVNLKVSFGGASGTASLSLLPTASPLIVSLGPNRVARDDQDLVVTADIRDPDNPTAGISAFPGLDWSCTRSDGAPCLSGTDEEIRSKSEVTATQYIIKSSKESVNLKSNVTYAFTLKVSATSGVKAEATSEVDVVVGDEDLPIGSIERLCGGVYTKTCYEKHNQANQLKLQVDMTDAKSDVQYQWSVNVEGVNLTKFTPETGTTSRTLVVESEFFSREDVILPEFSLKLSKLSRDGKTLESETPPLAVPVNAPPVCKSAEGKCLKVSPTEGLAQTTLFSFNLDAMFDKERDELTYEFGYMSEGIRVPIPDVSGSGVKAKLPVGEGDAKELTVYGCAIDTMRGRGCDKTTVVVKPVEKVEQAVVDDATEEMKRSISSGNSAQGVTAALKVADVLTMREEATLLQPGEPVNETVKEAALQAEKDILQDVSENLLAIVEKESTKDQNQQAVDARQVIAAGKSMTSKANANKLSKKAKANVLKVMEKSAALLDSDKSQTKEEKSDLAAGMLDVIGTLAQTTTTPSVEDNVPPTMGAPPSGDAPSTETETLAKKQEADSTMTSIKNTLNAIGESFLNQATPDEEPVVVKSKGGLGVVVGKRYASNLGGYETAFSSSNRRRNLLAFADESPTISYDKSFATEYQCQSTESPCPDDLRVKMTYLPDSSLLSTLAIGNMPSLNGMQTPTVVSGVASVSVTVMKDNVDTAVGMGSATFSVRMPLLQMSDAQERLIQAEENLEVDARQNYRVDSRGG